MVFKRANLKSLKRIRNMKPIFDKVCEDKIDGNKMENPTQKQNLRVLKRM